MVPFRTRSLNARYSYSDAELAELVVHAALAEQGCEEDFLPPVVASSPNGSGRCRLEKRRRYDGLSASSRGFSAGAATSPLAPVEERSRNNPDWAMVHARQAWFLQVSGRNFGLDSPSFGDLKYSM